MFQPKHRIVFDGQLVKEALTEALKLYNVSNFVDQPIRPMRPGDILPQGKEPVVLQSSLGPKDYVRLIDVDGQEAAMTALIQHDLDTMGPLHSFVSGFLAAKGKLIESAPAQGEGNNGNFQ